MLKGTAELFSEKVVPIYIISVVNECLVFPQPLCNRSSAAPSLLTQSCMANSDGYPSFIEEFHFSLS